jgi:hypothetical protein
MPQMMSPRVEWDNLSEDQQEGTFLSVEDCRARCMANLQCRQYSFDQEAKVCRTNVDPRLGRAGRGVSSGWIEVRIRDFEQAMEPCGNQTWPY